MEIKKELIERDLDILAKLLNGNLSKSIMYQEYAAFAFANGIVGNISGFGYDENDIFTNNLEKYNIILK